MEREWSPNILLSYIITYDIVTVTWSTTREPHVDILWIVWKNFFFLYKRDGVICFLNIMWGCWKVLSEPFPKTKTSKYFFFIIGGKYLLVILFSKPLYIIILILLKSFLYSSLKFHLTLEIPEVICFSFLHIIQWIFFSIFFVIFSFVFKPHPTS